MSTIARIFDAARCAAPRMRGWARRADARLDAYVREHPSALVLEIVLGTAVFLYDERASRVVLAYAVSVTQLHRRAASRMRGFPDVNVGVRRVLGPNAKPYDRGHFLGHASGGDLDINLFPHERALNRGWSIQGKEFRRLERSVAATPGTFFYHAATYTDDTWIPERLEYGLLDASAGWLRGDFVNR